MSPAFLLQRVDAFDDYDYDHYHRSWDDDSYPSTWSWSYADTHGARIRIGGTT